MILFSDLHLKEGTEDVVFAQVLPGILKAAHDLNDLDIGFLGDFWDVRYTLNVRLFNRVRDTLRQWATGCGVTLRILPGNHDQINVEGRNALEALDDIPGVSVYTNPVTDEYGYWMPYRKDVDEIIAALGGMGKGPGPQTLFIHHGVSGAMMNDLAQNSEGLTPAQFEGFDHVLCGHYHKRQKLGKVQYIGSPYQTSAHEAGNPKGYAVWDGSVLTYVDTDWGPKFHRVSQEVGEDVDVAGMALTDHIRVKLTGPGAENEAKKLNKKLAKAGYKDAVVTYESVPLQVRLRVDAAGSLRSYAEAYLAEMETDMDKGRLQKAFDYVVLP